MQFGRGKPSVGAFFDSDFTTIDSILALAVLYGLQGKNDCRMAVITASRPDLATVAYVDLVERYYHGPSRNFAQMPPVGMRTEGKPGETPKAFVAPFEGKKYTSQVKSVIDTGDPNTLFRNYLQGQYDQNAFFVLAGPATNLAAALEFRGMKELIAAKIKYLVVTSAEADVPAAKKLFATWPTSIVAVGPEVGAALEFPGASIDKEFKVLNPDNPVADAFRAWDPKLGNVPSRAMAAALYAGRPKEGYFKLSDPGTITVRDDGRTAFTASATGKHQLLVLDPGQKDKIIQTYVELASAKPVIRLRFRPDAADEKKDDKKDEKQ
jgi:purine nucleosidase